DGLRDAAGHVDDPGGLAPVLAGLMNTDRKLLAEVLTETLEVAGDTFAPLPAARRARIRELLYDLLDTMPTPADGSFLGELEAAGFVPGGDAPMALALELGDYLGDTIVRFIGAFLDRVGHAMLELLQDILRDLENAVEQFLDTLDDVIKD